MEIGVKTQNRNHQERAGILEVAKAFGKIDNLDLTVMQNNNFDVLLSNQQLVVGIVFDMSKYAFSPYRWGLKMQAYAQLEGRCKEDGRKLTFIVVGKTNPPAYFLDALRQFPIEIVCGDDILAQTTHLHNVLRKMFFVHNDFIKE